MANRVDPDQMPHSSESDLGLLRSTWPHWVDYAVKPQHNINWSGSTLFAKAYLPQYLGLLWYSECYLTNRVWCKNNNNYLLNVPSNQANSADDKWMIFSQKTRFKISCKLSPCETIQVKSQTLFSVKNRKINMNVVCWKFFTQHAVY